MGQIAYFTRSMLWTRDAAMAKRIQEIWLAKRGGEIIASLTFERARVISFY